MNSTNEGKSFAEWQIDWLWLCSCLSRFASYIFGAMKQAPVKDIFMFAEAWCLLALARLMLLFMPLKKLVPVMRYKRIKTHPPEQEKLILQRIQLAVARACVRSPWRTKCFEQALAAKLMTARRGINSTIFFGVAKTGGDEKLQAHAWVKCGSFIVTGWTGIDKYTVVGTF